MKQLPHFNTAFASVLRSEREHAQLTQSQLAELIEGSELTIRTLERAKQTPTMTTFLLIADALDIAPQSMLTEVLENMKKIS